MRTRYTLPTTYATHDCISSDNRTVNVLACRATLLCNYRPCVARATLLSPLVQLHVHALPSLSLSPPCAYVQLQVDSDEEEEEELASPSTIGVVVW